MPGKGRQIRGCWGLFSLATRPADALIPGASDGARDDGWSAAANSAGWSVHLFVPRWDSVG